MPSLAVHLILLVTFFLGQRNEANGEQMSCTDARRACERDDFCSLGLIAIQHHCGNVDGRSCEATPSGLVNCLMMLQDARIYRVFASCYCDPSSPEFAACHHQQRLTISNPCMNATGSAPSLSISSDGSSAIPAPTSAPGNCFKVIKACKEETVCQEKLQAFYDACPTRKHDTCRLTSAEERAVCTSAQWALDENLMNCTCEEDRSKCKRQRKRLQENPCVISAPTHGDITAAAPHRLTGDESVKGESEEEELDELEEECPVDESNVVIGPSGGYNNGASTCKEALTECTMNKVCRDDFSDILIKCNPQEIEEYCNRQECRSIVRKFFTDTSPIYTHALVFCHCQVGDIQCETIKRGLNPTCARSGIQNLDCLDLVQRCNEDSYCRSAYRNYQELCKPSDDESGCAYSYGACRSARVAIIMTIMGSSCSCDSNNTDCRYHQKMIFDNSCYDRSDKGYYSSIAPTEPADLPPTECVVNNSLNGMPYKVKPGSLALVPFGDRCYSMCICVYNGNLENCVTQPCPDDIHCTVNNIEYKHDELFSHPAYGYCICRSGNVLCTRRHESGSEKESQLVFPSISVAYDSQLQYHLNSQLEESFGDGSILRGLQSILDNQESVPCRLQLLENTDNTLLISVYYTVNMNACFNQMYRLSNMINMKHPAIHLNPTLSILKIATVEQGAHHQKQQNGRATSTLKTSCSLASYFLVAILSSRFSLCGRTL
ncbi:uncharacterized protein LOC587864 [Strongylocentrotus purpuratus]|uniref:GDNF/GAS1 domain-containing protein n=1 Tax=Strongylocentrotus purpuratus TaxID=7668 RepID=A0A7M7RGN1_STRPU|nr:uncharacterized protein LOC587864 [Strongylocentrotus purpuratus]